VKAEAAWKNFICYMNALPADQSPAMECCSNRCLSAHRIVTFSLKRLAARHNGKSSKQALHLLSIVSSFEQPRREE